MTWLHRLFRRRRSEEQLVKELRFHLDQHTSDLIAQGYRPEDARREARLSLGGPEQVKEMCRDARGTRWVGDLLEDLRYSLRMLWKQPAFTLIAALMLALGIGANTTIFSAIEATILHPFSFPNQYRLVAIYERNLDEGVNRSFVSPGSLRDWREQSQIFEQLVSLSVEIFELTGTDKPERIGAYYASAGFFTAFGVQPLLGRGFQPEEERAGHEQVVVLKYSLWQQRY